LTRTIGPFEVSPIGFGCMTLSHAYGTPPDAAHGHRILNEALDAGYTHLDTAALYGFGANETLIADAIGHRRHEYMLASKCGLHGEGGKRVLTNDPETLRWSCEQSLKRLGTDVIDLYYLHRYDKVTPLEDSIGTLADLVREGKVREIGLSEVSAKTLRRAHAVHPIAAVQSEYSLWTREPEIAVLDACRELGTTFVPFSPLARGFLTGKLTDVSALPEKDFRRNMPRFQPDNYAKNLQLLVGLGELADDVGCSTGQLSLAWLLNRDDTLVPIPGTTRSSHLAENIAASSIVLDEPLMTSLDALINRHTVCGERYVPATMAEIDTEQFGD
jgi:aryl-alcohol dehydrogenase-like predicted oxidoreductase